MFRRILLSAVGVGLGVGLLTAALQHVTTTPLIIAAEAYEDTGLHDHAASPALYIVPDGGPQLILAHTEGGNTAGAESLASDDGVERTFHTSLATVLLAIGGALMVLAAMVLRGGQINGRTGIAWGAAAFAAISLAPALGLPPELPGSAAAELGARQFWWIGTAIATACGIALLAFDRRIAVKAAALALIVLPHLIGAPHPEAYSSTVPAELSGHFAATSLVVAAVLWVLIGWASGSLYDRLGRGEPSPA